MKSPQCTWLGLRELNMAITFSFYDFGLTNLSILLIRAKFFVNSLRSSDAHMRQWIRSALVQIMACRLSYAKPLFKPILVCCHLAFREQMSMKFESEFYHFHSRKCLWNCRLPKWRPFFPVGDELNEVATCIDAPKNTCRRCSDVVLLVYDMKICVERQHGWYKENFLHEPNLQYIP